MAIAALRSAIHRGEQDRSWGESRNRSGRSFAIRWIYAFIWVMPMPMTTAEFEKFLAADVEKWRKVIEFAGIKPE